MRIMLRASISMGREQNEAVKLSTNQNNEDDDAFNTYHTLDLG